MALVNNASGVYTTLGYNFDDPNGFVKVLSANSQAYMNTIPPVITSWQAKDIANNSVGGYFQNPVANAINSIINYANSIINLANGNVISSNSSTANVLLNIANSTIVNTAVNFLAHTNRLSGVTPYTGDNTVPYYNSAVTAGKSVLYITNQTDGIINSSPILGSMTSILVGPQLNANANTIISDYNTLSATANSITYTQANQIYTDMNNVQNYMTNKQNADVQFYSNVQTFLANYNTVKQFSNLGETQQYLINNFIGTPSLVSKLNS